MEWWEWEGSGKLEALIFGGTRRNEDSDVDLGILGMDKIVEAVQIV